MPRSKIQVSQELENVGLRSGDLSCLRSDGLGHVLKKSERKKIASSDMANKDCWAWERKRLIKARLPAESSPGWWLSELPGGRWNGQPAEVVIVGVCLPVAKDRLEYWQRFGPSVEAIVAVDCAFRLAASLSCELVVYIPEQEVSRELSADALVSAVAHQLEEELVRRYGEFAQVKRLESLSAMTMQAGVSLSSMYPKRPLRPFGSRRKHSIWTELAYLATVASFASEGIKGRRSVLVFDHDQIRCGIGAQELVDQLEMPVPKCLVHYPVPGQDWRLRNKWQNQPFKAWHRRIDRQRRMFSSDADPVCLRSRITENGQAQGADTWQSFLIDAIRYNDSSVSLGKRPSAMHILDAFTETPPARFG